MLLFDQPNLIISQKQLSSFTVSYICVCLGMYVNLHSSLSNVIFSLSSQMTARGSSFGITPAAAPPPVPGQGSPSSASLLQGSMPSSPALFHPKTQSLGSAPGSPLCRSLSPCHPPLQGSPARATDISLSNVHVPLEAIRPSKDRRELRNNGVD